MFNKRGSQSARPVPFQEITIERLEHILSKTIKEGDCWLYTTVHHTGYTYLGFSIKNVYTQYGGHRVMYALTYGKNPPLGMVLDHLCRNRHCINPKHLEVVTQLENYNRGIRKQLSTEKRLSRTHCESGHQVSGDNVYIFNGYKMCKYCRLLRNRESYLRKSKLKKLRSKDYVI